MSNILFYVSDLHLEMLNTTDISELLPLYHLKVNTGDKVYLALLGDIGNPFQPNLEEFLGKIKSRFDRIFYVPGNHEYYNLGGETRCKSSFEQELEKICQKFQNITLLNNKTVDLDGIKLIGTTLWTNIPDANAKDIERYIADYHLMRDDNGNRITITDMNRWNAEAIDFIKREITDSPCVVLTHHAPLFSTDKYYTCDPIYIGSKLSSAYHNDLLNLIKQPIIAWLFGHTHYSCSFRLPNNILICSNQLGYTGENCKNRFRSYAYFNLDKLSLEFL